MPGIEKAMRLLRYSLSIIMLVAAGCTSSSPPKATVEVSDASSSESPRAALEDESMDAGVGPGQRFEGAARPSGIVIAEPVLPKPDFPPPGADTMVSVPGGTLRAGSPVQDVLRVNYAEMDLAPFKIKPFEIDTLPYPNDPRRAFVTNVTKADAERMCGEQGKRLCTELEWEWACKSSDNRRYPSGNSYLDAEYSEAEPLSPASPFGVFAMGRLLEWTADPWGMEPDQIERGVAKGYAAGFEMTPEAGRRCAARWRRFPTGTDGAMGFRCCRGEINEAKYEIEPPRPPFSLYKTMKPERFSEIIRSIPELKAVHDNPHMFSDADIRTVMARRGSDRDDLADKGIHFRWKPIRWIPRQGMELWVAVGRSNRHSFIVALHEVEDNEVYVHASSLVLWDQPTALALGYREGHRAEMYWAPCWGCRDGGTVAFDDEKNEVIITHRW